MRMIMMIMMKTEEQSLGEDASELFHTHHTSARALATLKRFEIGHFADGEGLFLQAKQAESIFI